MLYETKRLPGAGEHKASQLSAADVALLRTIRGKMRAAQQTNSEREVAELAREVKQWRRESKLEHLVGDLARALECP